MRKLNFSIKEMLNRDEMKKIKGGSGGSSCINEGAVCNTSLKGFCQVHPTAGCGCFTLGGQAAVNDTFNTCKSI